MWLMKANSLDIKRRNVFNVMYAGTAELRICCLLASHFRPTHPIFSKLVNNIIISQRILVGGPMDFT